MAEPSQTPVLAAKRPPRLPRANSDELEEPATQGTQLINRRGSTDSLKAGVEEKCKGVGERHLRELGA